MTHCPGWGAWSGSCSADLYRRTAENGATSLLAQFMLYVTMKEEAYATNQPSPPSRQKRDNL
jgi:hypothetical protein